jgi:hypothetical protein
VKKRQNSRLLCNLIKTSPGRNPHGEESEILYQIDQKQLEGIEIKINPDLEILW